MEKATFFSYKDDEDDASSLYTSVVFPQEFLADVDVCVNFLDTMTYQPQPGGNGDRMVRTRFDLASMARECLTKRETNSFWTTVAELLHFGFRNVLNGMHSVEENFTHLSAEDVAVVFSVVDQVYCGGQISKTLQEFGCTLCACVGDHVPSQSTYYFANISRRGLEYHLCISESALLKMFEEEEKKHKGFPFVFLCGRECKTRLEALIVIVQHEIARLMGLSPLFSSLSSMSCVYSMCSFRMCVCVCTTR